VYDELVDLDEGARVEQELDARWRAIRSSPPPSSARAFISSSFLSFSSLDILSRLV
jgi:hypothetical protein